jgi:hypothetical protein
LSSNVPRWPKPPGIPPLGLQIMSAGCNQCSLSYIGVLAYLILQGRGMTERTAQRASEAPEELRRVVGFSAADEIEKLDRLKKAGSISEAEFVRLRANLVQ